MEQYFVGTLRKQVDMSRKKPEARGSSVLDGDRTRENKTGFDPLAFNPTNDAIEIPVPITYDEMTNSTTVGNIAISSTGIVYIPDDVTEDEWFSAFKMADQVHKAVWWIIADLAVFASDKWGQKYEWIAERFGYTVTTVTNMAYVARQIQFSLRRENLTPSHHKIVVGCSTSDKKRFLDLAENNGWSSKELAFYIEHGRIPESTGELGKFEMKIISMYDKYFDTLNGKPLTQSEFESIKRSAKALVKSIDDGLEQLERNIVKR